MTRRAAGLSGVILAGLALAGGARSDFIAPSPEPRADTLRARVEASVTPLVAARGKPVPAYRIRERMARYRVPGVSVAVLNGGEIAWAAGYGVADAVEATPVTPATLFQAASISKPVAAVAALRLVEEGVLSLGSPVADRLASWRLPDGEGTSARGVTLRGLLTHTAGLTVHGFPGYRRDARLPTVPEILDGREPANTDAVRLFTEPGTEHSYSGGGYTVVQQLLEDVTGEPFPALLRRLVLDPAGMERSTYRQPLPEERWGEAASGHDASGERVEGKWHVYPEMAAAGLWTTPTELLLLAREVRRAAEGAEDGILSPEMAHRAIRRTTPDAVDEAWGLGFGLTGEGEARMFGHGGSNHGFKAQLWAYVDGTGGAAVMTNGDRGSVLAREILLGIARVHGWAGLEPDRIDVAAPSPEALEALAGAYAFGEPLDVTAEVRVGEGGLGLRWPDRGEWWLLPTSDTTFVVEESGDEVRFEGVGGGAETVIVVVHDRFRGERVR